jgi:hypothetical protein
MLETIFLIGLVIAVFVVVWLYKLVSLLMVDNVTGPGPVLLPNSPLSGGQQQRDLGQNNNNNIQAFWTLH